MDLRIFFLVPSSLQLKFAVDKIGVWIVLFLYYQACNNPDCLYLHEIGSQEDSFTKAKIISVQKITGTSNALENRSGSMLPLPLDAYCSDSSTGKYPSTVSSIKFLLYLGLHHCFRET